MASLIVKDYVQPFSCADGLIRTILLYSVVADVHENQQLHVDMIK